MKLAKFVKIFTRKSTTFFEHRSKIYNGVRRCCQFTNKNLQFINYLFQQFVNLFDAQVEKDLFSPLSASSVDHLSIDILTFLFRLKSKKKIENHRSLHRRITITFFQNSGTPPHPALQKSPTPRKPAHQFNSTRLISKHSTNS